ncbi:hypothetical protein Tco_0577677 [Tanacetum coccineum]
MKIHDVPITVFTEDDSSAIATKVGTLLMLYSYTLVMCTELWVYRPKKMGTTPKKTKMVFEKDSESKVEEVQNKTANFMASKISKVNKGYIRGTGAKNSSLNEQRKKSYGVDPYDDANFNTLILTDVVIVRLQQEVLQLPRQST